MIAFLEFLEKLFPKIKKGKEPEEQDKHNREDFVEKVNQNPRLAKEALKDLLEKQTGLSLPQGEHRFLLEAGKGDKPFELKISSNENERSLVDKRDQNTKEEFMQILKENPFKTREMLNEFVQKQHEIDPLKYTKLKDALDQSFKDNALFMDAQKDKLTKEQFINILKENPDNVKRLFSDFLRENVEKKYDAYKEKHNHRIKEIDIIRSKLDKTDGEAMKALNAIEKMYTQALYNTDITIGRDLKQATIMRSGLLQTKDKIERLERLEQHEEKEKTHSLGSGERQEKDKQREKAQDRSERGLEMDR